MRRRSRKSVEERRLRVEQLEDRRMLVTVGAISMQVEQTAVEAVRRGIISFTKTLTDPQQDYSATVNYTVGFFQEPDGDGGIAETDDTSVGWGNYSITLGIGESYKEIEILALLDSRPETYEELFFYITSVAPVGDWEWSPGSGVNLPIHDAIPYGELVPTAYFCSCSCGCASVTNEANAATGFVRANTQPRNPGTNSGINPASGSDGGMQQAAVGGYSGGLSYNSVSVAKSIVGEIVDLSGWAGGAEVIKSTLVLHPDTEFEVEVDTRYYDPSTANSASDGFYQFAHLLDSPPANSGALRTPYRLIVEEVGNNIWHVSEGVINRRGNAFPEFGAGWAPPFLQKLIFDPGGQGIFLAEGSGNLFWFGGLLGIDTLFDREDEDGDHGYSSIVRDGFEYELTNKRGNIAIFNLAGQLVEWRDRNHNRTLFTYDDDRLDEVSFPSGRVLTYSYTNGIISSIADSMGPTVTFGHSGGYITSYTEPDPDGAGPLTAQTVSFSYTEASPSLLESIIDPASNQWQFTYAYDRVASLTSPGESTEWFAPPLTYGLAGSGDAENPSPLFPAEDAHGTYIDAHGHESILKVNFTDPYQIGWLGLLTEEIDPLDNVTKFERDRIFGYILSLTFPDPDGAAGPLTSPTQSYTYTTHNGFIAPTGMTLPNGGELEWEYNWNFVIPTKFTDQFDNVTHWTLDEDYGNVLEERIVIGLSDLSSSETDDIVITFTYTDPQVISTDPPGGLATSITDPLGRVTELDYDSQGNLTQITYAVGTTVEAFVQFDYDAWGQLITFTDELGRQTDYDYDTLKRLVGLTLPDPDGAGALGRPVSTWRYDQLNQLVETIDPLARSVAFAYDSRRNNTHVHLPDHDDDLELTTTEYAYEVGNLLTGVTDSLGRATTYGYDNLDRPITVTTPDPDGAGPLVPGVWEIGYDNLGRVVERTDPLGNTTTYAYTGFTSELLVTLADPDGEGPLASPTVTQSFDLAGNLVEAIDPLGRTTSYEYDELGRLVRVTLPDPDGAGPLTAPVTEYEYDKVGNLRFVTDALGNTTEYVYDERNRLVEVIQADPDGGGPLASPEWQYAYDDAGQLISATDPLSRVTAWHYDGLGRLTSVTLPDPDGAGPLASPVTTYAYDAASRLLSVTDPLGNVTQYDYDALDNLIETTQPDPDGAGSLASPVTAFTYDAVGNLLTLTDPVGNTTTWVYDNLDRVTTETNELAKTRTFKYDAVGNLTERVDRLGRTTVWEYDNLYRNTAEKWYDGANLVRTLSFSFDAAGQLLSAADPAATYGFTYDNLGRVTSELQEIGGLAFDIEYESQYDANSRRTELLAILDGQADFENTYLYDNLNRLTVLQQQSGGAGPGANVVAAKRIDFAYNAASQFSQIDRYAGGSEFVASSFYTYDGMGRLSKLTHNESATPGSGWGNDPLAGYAFTYDIASRITAIDSYVDGLTEYDYDATSQLTGADHTGQTDEAYSYDENGNRTMSGYTTGDNNRLTSDGTYNYTYDDEGNRLTKTAISTGEKEEYAWDHRNRLSRVTFKNSGGTVTKTVDFVYDPFDRLIRRTIDPDGATGSAALVDSFFSWEDDQINLEFDGSSASDLVSRYLWNPAAIDQILAVENVSSLLSAGDVVWPLTDHLGTPRDLASYDSGTGDTTIENHRIFDSFGQLTSETNGSFTIAIGFTGVLFDITTGLNYHRARWLDPRTGRWMSEDPIGFAGGDSNLARYVSNSALMFSDPSGLEHLSDKVIAAADYTYTLLNPHMWMFRNWLYTGELLPSKEITEAAKGGAGDCYNNNKGKAHATLDVISTADPTPVTDGVQVTLYVLEEDYDNAKTTAGTAAIGPAGDLLKAGKMVVVIGKKGTSTGGDLAKVIPPTEIQRIPNPNGMKGAPDHQAGVDDLLDELKGEFPPSEGYETLSSKSIEKYTGLKRKPDGCVIKDGKVLVVGEVARTNKDGTLVIRERRKLEDYGGAEIPSRIRTLPRKQ